MRLFFLAALLFCYLACISGYSQTTPSQLVDAMRDSRQKIQSYTVACRVHGPMGDIWSNMPTDNNSDTDVYYEWSRTNEHSVVAVCDHGRGPWKIRGLSNGVWFMGDGTSGIHYRRFRVEPDPGHTFLRMFDPLAIGLGFRNEFENGNNLDFSLDALKRWAIRPNIESRLEFQGSRARWNYGSDTEIVFDTKHSYWPVSLKYPTYGTPEITWAVTLGQNFGTDLPLIATLISRSPRAEERTVVEFDWISINEKISSGKECVKRLGEKFGIVVDSEETTQGTVE